LNKQGPHSLLRADRMTPYEARRGWPPRSFWLGFRLLSVCPVVQSFAMEHNTEESQQETQLEQFLLHATTGAFVVAATASLIFRLFI
jgi:hypothetical protein